MQVTDECLSGLRHRPVDLLLIIAMICSIVIALLRGFVSSSECHVGVKTLRNRKIRFALHQLVTETLRTEMHLFFPVLSLCFLSFSLIV